MISPSFADKKKNRKTTQFWSEVGARVGHSGDEIESLLKNLQQQYQQQKQQCYISGCETFTPLIRNSAELFRAFDDYYQMFYPKGGSALPALVMTEQSVQFMYRKLVNVASL